MSINPRGAVDGNTVGPQLMTGSGRRALPLSPSPPFPKRDDLELKYGDTTRQALSNLLSLRESGLGEGAFVPEHPFAQPSPICCS